MELAERMNFDYVIYEVPDGQWGVQVSPKFCVNSDSPFRVCFFPPRISLYEFRINPEAFFLSHPLSFGGYLC